MLETNKKGTTMKRTYTKPTTIIVRNRLKYNILEPSPTLPFDPEDGTDDSFVKGDARMEDNGWEDTSWDENIW